MKQFLVLASLVLLMTGCGVSSNSYYDRNRHHDRSDYRYDRSRYDRSHRHRDYDYYDYSRPNRPVTPVHRDTRRHYRAGYSNTMASRVIGHYMDIKAEAISRYSRNADVSVVTDENGLPALQLIYTGDYLIAFFNGFLSDKGEVELDYICNLMKDEKHTQVSIVASTRKEEGTGLLMSVDAIRDYLAKRGIAKRRIVYTDVVRGGEYFTDYFTITFAADNNMIRRADRGSL